MLSMIAIIGRNREIGCNNKLLWDLPGDMKHFRETTSDHTVIMGQKTFESIGKALPERKNIVLSLNPDFKAEGCEISNNLEEIANRYKDSSEEVFVIGGANIYRQFLAYAQKLYLTLVEDSPEADVFFPEYPDFKNIIFESEMQEENNIKYKFIELTR